jgi:hypothetical protein
VQWPRMRATEASGELPLAGYEARPDRQANHRRRYAIQDNASRRSRAQVAGTGRAQGCWYDATLAVSTRHCVAGTLAAGVASQVAAVER